MQNYSRLLFTILCIFSVSKFSKANDIVTLTNNKTFSGKVTKINGCIVHFRVNLNVYEIPADSISSLLFEDSSDNIYMSYIALSDSGTDKCLKGRMDAKKYHGNGNLHFFLGTLLGPFSMITTALSNPTPSKGKNTLISSPNKELFTDPEYLKCYKHKAKMRNLGFNAIGFVPEIILFIYVVYGRK